MTFLTPGLALLAAGIGVPSLILLHVLRLRRLPQRVPSTLLWRRSVQDLEANVPFQRLRFSLLFLLQMLALLCAALAAGQPVLRSDEAPSTLVIVLDARARTRASVESTPPVALANSDAVAAATNAAVPTEGGAIASRAAAPVPAPVSRFDRAKARARAVIEDRAGSETQVHLIVARATPGLIASGSSGAVLDALERLRFTDEPGDADAAMALAAELAADGEILWVGDARGDRQDNVGLTILSAQRSVREPGTVDVLVSAVNSGSLEVDAPLIVTLDGATHAARVLRLPAAAERPGDPGRATVLLRVPETPGALLDARLALDDALPLDDRAALRFAPATPIRVAFIAPDDRTADASPLRALLSLMEAVQIERLPCDAPSEALDGFDLIVADGCAPRAITTAGFKTPWLVYAASPARAENGAASGSGNSAGNIDGAGNTLVTRWRTIVPGAARAHPVMQGVPPLSVDVYTSGDAPGSTPGGASGAPAGAPIQGAADAALPTGAIALLADRDHVLAYIDPRAPGVRFRFPLTATDWPADPSWVMAMQNAVQWLVGDDGEGAGQPIRTGVATRMLTERRDGRRAWVTVPPQARVGVIEVLAPGGDATPHPVSLLDEAQSDLRMAPAPADPRGFEHRSALRDSGADRTEGAAGRTRPLWRWLALAALALVLLEWCVYLVALNRRAG